MEDEIRAAIETPHPSLDKEILELMIIKKSGETLVGHFNKMETLLAVIRRYDKRSDTLAIDSGINRIKPGRFESTNNVAPKRERSKAGDIDRITGILFDIDPIRANGDRKDSTTDEEHRAGLETANWLKHELAFMGWPEPVVGDSGNGGQLRYLTDLPATEDSSNLIKRALEAANNILPAQFKGRVEVDGTTYDRPRISKVLGTVSRKGAGTEERSWRRSKILSKPEKLELVQLENILKLIQAGKLATSGENPKPILKDRTKTISEVKNDPNIRPCLKEIILNKDIKRLEEVSAHEHKGRVAIATELIMAGYSDSALHEFFSRLDNYDFQKTDYQLNQIRKSFIEEGGKPWKCNTLREKGIVPPHRCKNCKKLRAEDNSDANASGPVSAWATLTLEQLTKATGKIIEIDPDTGDPVLDENLQPVKVPKLTLSPSRASKAITDFMNLRLSETDTSDKPKIWRIDGGIWKPDGEKEIITAIDSVIGDLSYEKGLKETLLRIRSQTKKTVFDGNAYLFPALDCVIDLQTGDKREYRPDDYLTFQYGAAFDDPNADYRLVLWLLCSSLPDPRDVLTALDITTVVVIRQTFEAIIQLIGPGGNGKGLFERVLTKLCTEARTTAITLTEAKASRFGPGALIGRDLWILSEVKDVKQAINLLKKVSTGELTDSDIKYGDRIKGKPHVLPVLDCNNAIDFGDDSWGRKRRVVKLDFPYTFDYVAGTRRKDPHLEDKVTTPATLSGLLQIIVARAPYLCKSRRIYTRKRPEEMDAEYKRQQFSLHYFCEECLSTSMPVTDEGKALDVKAGMACPDGLTPRLTTISLLEEYLEYCKLFNVPVPAEKGQIGKYIKEKFGIASTVTREDNQQIRYYPGLWLSKTSNTAYAELSLSYTSYSKATAKLQENEGKNTIKSLLATAATEEWPKKVIEEIERMHEYIKNCENPQDISYEGFLKYAVAPVAAVAGSQQIAVLPKSPVAKRVAAVAEGIDAELKRIEELAKAKEEHFSKQAVNHMIKAEGRSSCIICDDPIGPGHSNYFGKYCSSCGPKMPIFRASAEVLVPFQHEFSLK
jgi:phage/plasmid-associated DNA primase